MSKREIIDAADEALARACAVFKIGDRVRWIGKAPANPYYNPGEGTVKNVTSKRVCVLFDNFAHHHRARAINMLPRDLQPIENCSIGKQHQKPPLSPSDTPDAAPRA